LTPIIGHYGRELHVIVARSSQRSPLYLGSSAAAALQECSLINSSYFAGRLMRKNNS
jgi:hypothetical protein